MTNSRKIVASTLLLMASFVTIPTQTLAGSDSFYQALAKTQKQQYNEAIQDLDVLSRQLQKQGDKANAYLSQAIVSVIRYDQESLAEYKEKGYRSARPDWMHFGTCLDSGTKANEEGCFGASWVTPHVNIKNFGGLVVFDNHLEYFKDSFPVRGILDAVVVPKLQRNELVTSFCKINNGVRKGQQAFALVTYSAKQNKYTRIRRAWYPDFQSKRIQPIRANSVKCTAIET